MKYNKIQMVFSILILIGGLMGVVLYAIEMYQGKQPDWSSVWTHLIVQIMLSITMIFDCIIAIKKEKE